MQATRPLLVVVLLALFAIVGVWMLGFRDPAPVAPPPAGANPTAGVGNVERSEAAKADPGVAPETNSRTEAPAGQAGAGAGAGTGPALVGQVLDERASPVVGAVVTCSPGLGGGLDFENLEAFDFEAGLDPDAWRERLQGAARERTETATDAEGRFRLAVAGQGRSVQLRVRAPSHVVLDRSVGRPAGKDSDLGVLTLKSGAIVSGRVLDRSGKSVVGARVSREEENDRVGQWGDFEIPGGDDILQAAGIDGGLTDAEGRFSLPYCAPGKFALRARHPDHPSARLAGLAVEPGARLADVLIVAEPGASIRGRILGTPEGSKPLRVMASVKAPDGAGEAGAAGRAVYGFLGDTGELMADAGLGVGEKQVQAGPDQSFELRGLQVGKTYRVWATQTGRGFAGNSACTERSEVAAGTVGLELHYDPGISVTFQVVGARSGEPVEKMAVRDQLRGGSNGIGDFMNYMPRSGGRARSYPDGKVILANLRPTKKQTLSLSIEALGFATLERKDIALPATGTLDLGTLKLDPAPVLEVTVTSGAEQRPVAGATVRLTGASRSGSSRENPFAQLEGMVSGAGGGGTRSGRTDAEGRCTLNALVGAMVVGVTSKEFAPYASEPLTLQPGENGSHAVALVSGGTVEVTVVDNNGAFLRDSRIEHAPPSGNRGSRQTNQDGVALFEHLAPGAHRFRLRKGGQGNGPDIAMFTQQLGGDRQPAEEPDWQSVTVEDGGKATLQLAKDPTASLRGIVRENGVPLAGARISFSEGLGNGAAEGALETRVAGALEQFGGGGGNRSARSDKDGNYQLKDLPAGAHRLRITATGRVMPTTMIVSLRNGENVVDIELDVTIVRGTVRDGAGQPVAGAAVSIGPVDAGAKSGDRQGRGIEEAMAYAELAGVGGGRSAVKTGDDGRYELRGVQPGKAMQVRASAKGYAPAVSGIVEVAQGMTQDGVDVQLGAAGRIKVTMAEAPAFATVQGRLLGADGTPDASATPVMQMMRRGAATLDGLRPGRWSVRVTVPGGEAQEPRIVDVTAGETATLSY